MYIMQTSKTLITVIKTNVVYYLNPLEVGALSLPLHFQAHQIRVLANRIGLSGRRRHCS